MLKHWPALTAFALLIIAYTIVNLVLPIDAESLTRYDLTANEARALRLSVVLPLIFIWMITMYGYIRLKNYALSIKEGEDGRALSLIANGILGIVLWLPFSGLVNNAISYLYRQNPGLTEELVIFRNHLGVVALFIIVYFVWKGSRIILDAVHQDAYTFGVSKLNIFVGLLSLTFAYLVLTSPVQSTVTQNGTPAAYYLPDELLVFTFIIPYIIIWFMGAHAIANMRAYRKRVKGAIYRSALRYLTLGLGTSIISLLLVRYLGSLVAWLDELDLKPILALLYFLIFIIGLGAILIAIGAKKLQRIEEV